MSDDDKINELISEGRIKSELLKKIDREKNPEDYEAMKKECENLLEQIRPLMIGKAVGTYHKLLDWEEELDKKNGKLN